MTWKFTIDLCIFLWEVVKRAKKWLRKKKWVHCFFFFHSLKVFFWKIGRLARILWNRVLIMLFRGKEFRKRLAATETAAEIDEDCFQEDHWDTDDDDVPSFSPSVAPQNVTCPPPSNKKPKIDKEKRFRWTTDMVEELIRCLAGQKSLYEFKDLDFEADLVQVYTNIRVMMAERYSENKEFSPVSEIEI